MAHICMMKKYCSYVKHMLQMRDTLHVLDNNSIYMVHWSKQIDTKINFFSFPACENIEQLHFH